MTQLLLELYYLRIKWLAKFYFIVPKDSYKSLNLKGSNKN